MARIVAIVSGGLDSVTMAYHLHDQGHELDLLSINYGQRHVKEHLFAELAAQDLGATHDVADLSPIGRLLSGSSLTDLTIDVPERNWGVIGDSPNIVPNRNALLLSAAFAVAVARRAEAVAVGLVADDHRSVPDSTPEFLDSFLAMEKIATLGYSHPDLTLTVPFQQYTKSEVVVLGEQLSVPWDKTWTCLRGGAVHCGRCAACWERQVAFQDAGVNDPTRYEQDVRTIDRS
jgi:7-cyano-7-deazaguanine synthase